MKQVKPTPLRLPSERGINVRNLPLGTRELIDAGRDFVIDRRPLLLGESVPLPMIVRREVNAADSLRQLAIAGFHTLRHICLWATLPGLLYV